MKSLGFLKKSMIAVFAAAAFYLPAGDMSPEVYAEGDNGSFNLSADEDVLDRNIYAHEKHASDSTDPVGVQLILAMDTSGSMTDEEFAIELKATAIALNSELFRNAIKYKAGEQSVAVAVIDFNAFAMLRIAWVDIRGKEINDKPYNPADPLNSSLAPDKLDKLADEIMFMPRRGAAGTVIGAALDLSHSLFLGSPWKPAEGGKRVLDVFGDGSSSPAAVVSGRNRLERIGVTINGFAIVNEESDLEKYFENYLVSKRFVKSKDGFYSEPGRVWAVARNLKATGNEDTELKSFFGEVSRAMKQKITVEVAGLDGYRRTLARLERLPAFPLPEPL